MRVMMLVVSVNVTTTAIGVLYKMLSLQISNHHCPNLPELRLSRIYSASRSFL
jgi:hypothetical protein